MILSVFETKSELKFKMIHFSYHRFHKTQDFDISIHKAYKYLELGLHVSISEKLCPQFT